MGRVSIENDQPERAPFILLEILGAEELQQLVTTSTKGGGGVSGVGGPWKWLNRVAAAFRAT